MTNAPQAEPQQGSTRDLELIRSSVAVCETTHVGHEYPFCEGFGCMAMRELLDHAERLTRALEAVRKNPSDLASEVALAYRKYDDLWQSIEPLKAELAAARQQIAENEREIADRAHLFALMLGEAHRERDDARARLAAIYKAVKRYVATYADENPSDRWPAMQDLINLSSAFDAATAGQGQQDTIV